MKRMLSKTLKRFLSVTICLLVTFSGVPLNGFMDLKFPDFSKFNFSFLKALAFSEIKSDDGKFYIDEINSTNVSIKGIVSEDSLSDDGVLTIPSKIIYNDTEYIVTSIGDEAFYECTKLSSIPIPASVTNIGRMAFEECTALQDVKFEDRKEDETLTIGNWCFSGCESLTRIELEKSNVTELVGATFMDCTSLDDVTLPNTLVSVGGGVFHGCKSLSNVTLSEEMTALNDYGIMPETYFFYGCENLKQITIPANIETIGTNAFRDSGLQKITFAEGSKLTTISDSAFNGSKLQSITISASVTEIGSSAFAGCTALEEVVFKDRSETALTIGNYVFSGCSHLTNINFEKSNATSVGASAFADCVSLKSITIPATVTSIGNYAFNNCSALSSIMFTERTENQNLTIGNYAFRNTGLTSVTLPATVTTIGKYAFYYCSSLKNVFFEDGTVLLNQIYENSFDTTNTNVSIAIPLEDSELAVKLIDYGILYKAQETGMKDDGTRCIDIDKTSYTSSTSGITASNVVNLKLKYSFKDEVVEYVTPKKLTIKVPQNTSLYSTAIKVNGTEQVVSVNSNKQIVLKVAEKEVEIEFAIKLTNTRHLISYAKLEYEISGETKTELLGIVNIGSNLLTVTAPAMTSRDSATVYGYTNPGAKVTINVDGIEVANVEASQSGNYSCNINLENPVHKKTYEINAKSGTKNAYAYVQYNEDSVNITTAKMYFRGTEYDMLSQVGTSPRISWASNAPFTFKVQTDNNKAVKYIAVVSQKGAEVKYLEMTYDETSDSFVTSGFENYVPGTLSVNIIDSAGKEILIDNFLNVEELSEDELADKTEVKVNNNTFSENTVEGCLDADVMVDNTEIINISAEQNICNENISHDELIESGYIQITDDDGNTVYSKIEFDEEKAEISVHSYRFVESSSLYTCSDNGLLGVGSYILDTVLKIDFEDMGIVSGDEIELLEFLATIEELFGDIEGIGERVSLFVDYVKYAIEQISQEELSVEQRLEKIQHLFVFSAFYSFGIKLEIASKGLVYAYDAVFVTSMKTVGLDFLAGIVSSWVDGELEAAFDEDGDASTEGYYTVCDQLYEFYFGKSFFEEEIDFNPIKEDASVDYSFMIDPSGYVYEAVPCNRLDRVKTTIYYSSNSDGSNAIVWDASEYDQANPIYTDKNGCYAWDVPEGFWQVKYEKEGYETAYSEWLPVPPPQLEVNQALVSVEKPEVEFVNVSTDKIEITFTQYVNTDTVNLQNVFVTDSQGNKIEGNITPVSNENGLSKSYIINPNRALYGKVNLSFSANIKSYNNKNLDEIVVIGDVSEFVESIETREEIFATINENKTIFIKANPMNSAYKKELAINIIDSNIAELISENVCFDNEGNAAIEIKALLPGKTDIEFHIEGTSIRKVVSFVVSATELAFDKSTDIYSLSIISNNKTVIVGETKVLAVQIEPEQMSSSNLLWHSNNENIAKVNNNGVITAISEGEVTITVSTKNGKVSSSCTMIVLPQKYDVTWVVEEDDIIQSFIVGSTIIEPVSPTKTGYTFTGWTPEVPDIMPAEDLTFTATWTANTYDAVFDANGGKWADGTAKKTVPTAFDSQIAAPEAPVKQGYIFSKWSSEVGVMDSVDGKTFVAEWIAATDTHYTVETYTMNTSGEYVKTTNAFKGTTGESVSVNPTVQTGFTLNKSKSVISGNVAADNSFVLKVYIDRNTYTLTTVADGISVSTKYLYGSLIAEPATPVKTGYKFIKWDKTLPETMPAKNITLTAIFDTAYTCPDCGDEIVGESAITEHIAAETRAKSTVSIKNNLGTKTIKYGETLRLTAIASKPDDVVICWYVDGAKKGEGTTFDLTFESGTKTVEVKLEDADGNIVCNSSGAEISDSEEVTVNAGFFQKIISFFKNLFRMDRTVVQ